MKSEIDSLMFVRNFDAIIVFGNAENNPPMTYLTGGGHVSGATLIKKRGKDAVLFCNGMERDEAAKSHLEVHLYDEYPWQELLEQAKGDTGLVGALRLKNILTGLGVSGRVGIYGHVDLGGMFGMLTEVQKTMPDVEFIGEARENSLFMVAMETKDEIEVARIRRMGKITTEVVGLTAEYLTSCQVNLDEILLKNDGTPLKLGDVKERITLWLAERQAVPSEGFIFALGRDAGVPHSQGNPNDFMCLGKTIVFDIYPQEPGGGYFYDFTRTWSLGYGTSVSQKYYNQVHKAYVQIVASLEKNTKFKDYQGMACEIFEEDGYPTQRTQKAPLEGYIHSLGHGVGLNIHERPWSGLNAADDNLLIPGTIITIEPGLYFPDQGMGFRIEDTYWVRPDGKFELLAEFPYDFVLPMKKWKKTT